jgi:hypothetical protein
MSAVRKAYADFGMTPDELDDYIGVLMDDHEAFSDPDSPLFDPALAADIAKELAEARAARV